MSRLNESLDRLQEVVNVWSERDMYLGEDALRNRLAMLTSLREIFKAVRAVGKWKGALLNEPKIESSGADFAFVMKGEFSKPGQASAEIVRFLKIEFGIKLPHRQVYKNAAGADIFWTGGTYNGFNAEVSEEFVFGNRPIIVIGLEFPKR